MMMVISVDDHLNEDEDEDDGGGDCGDDVIVTIMNYTKSHLVPWHTL